MTLRKLVKEARRANVDRDRQRQASECAYRFMSAMASNIAGFEEASRALFANDAAKFRQQTEACPADVRDYVRYLAYPLGFAQAWLAVEQHGWDARPPAGPCRQHELVTHQVNHLVKVRLALAQRCQRFECVFWRSDIAQDASIYQRPAQLFVSLADFLVRRGQGRVGEKPGRCVRCIDRMHQPGIVVLVGHKRREGVGARGAPAPA